VKLLFTALIIAGVLYGIFHFAQVGYGWFQMSGVVDAAAEKELPGIIDRALQHAGLPPSAFGGGGDRYGKIREAIMKGATEANVPLRPDDVAVGIVDNMLDIRLNWDAPLVVYKEQAYLEIPMSMQRRFSLQKRRGY
jgi:type III secretion system FlhB-like substrate exporter